MYDGVVIGGGFYGTTVASYLITQRGFSRVALIEQEKELLTRASYNNQARVHNGYHYPRSYTTAYRSRMNLARFVRDYPQTVKRDFTQLYAIARRNSKVTAKQFERLCHEIDARLEPASESLRALFEPKLIEEVFMVEEYAFDANRLRSLASSDLRRCGVEIRFDTRVINIHASEGGTLVLDCEDNEGSARQFTSRYVFNCTYSGLNQFGGQFPGSRTGLKHEITEIALMEVPPMLQDLGVTVMDGAFFSIMPFPTRGLYALTHVRYTPHCHWNDTPNINPYVQLKRYGRETRVDRMVRDASRYLPAVGGARHVDSIYEIKTVLVKNEGDDGRPILFERYACLPNCYSILGGKMDNIYDVLEKLDAEQLTIC